MIHKYRELHGSRSQRGKQRQTFWHFSCSLFRCPFDSPFHLLFFCFPVLLAPMVTVTASSDVVYSSNRRNNRPLHFYSTYCLLKSCQFLHFAIHKVSNFRSRPHLLPTFPANSYVFLQYRCKAPKFPSLAVCIHRSTWWCYYCHGSAKLSFR